MRCITDPASSTSSKPMQSDVNGVRRLILASASPRRKLLMSQIGLEFEIRVPGVEEPPVVDDFGGRHGLEAQVINLARAKAEAVISTLGSVDAHTLVIGADTVVLVSGRVLGKPSGPAEAVEMLGTLSGRSHDVYTGVAVLDVATGRIESGAECTTVTFVDLARDWIERYVGTGEPLDKAGAYAVQGLGSIFVERVEGCYFNVVGLPLTLLARLLRRQGYDVIQAW